MLAFGSSIRSHFDRGLSRGPRSRRRYAGQKWHDGAHVGCLPGLCVSALSQPQLLNIRLGLAWIRRFGGGESGKLGAIFHLLPSPCFYRADPARLLLTFKANMHLTDKFHGNTALHWAVTMSNHNVMSLLLDHGASLDHENLKGTSLTKTRDGVFETCFSFYR